MGGGAQGIGQEERHGVKGRVGRWEKGGGDVLASRGCGVCGLYGTLQGVCKAER